MGLATPHQEPYPHFRPFGPQAAALRALLNQYPGMKKSKSGHSTTVYYHNHSETLFCQ